MRLEVVRTVADWLGEDVNTRIANVPRDGGDGAPLLLPTYIDTASPTPHNLAIFDETRHAWVAEGKEPPASPALYVVSRGPIRLQGEPVPNGQMRRTVSPLAIYVLYLTGDADTALAVRSGDYTIRAVARSLRELSTETPLTSAFRQRNGINLVLGEGPMEHFPILRSVGTFRVTGILGLQYHVRDQNPSY